MTCIPSYRPLRHLLNLLADTTGTTGTTGTLNPDGLAEACRLECMDEFPWVWK